MTEQILSPELIETINVKMVAAFANFTRAMEQLTRAFDPLLSNAQRRRIHKRRNIVRHYAKVAARRRT
jgi:hypothetical protein